MLNGRNKIKNVTRSEKIHHQKTGSTVKEKKKEIETKRKKDR